MIDNHKPNYIWSRLTGVSLDNRRFSFIGRLNWKHAKMNYCEVIVTKPGEDCSRTPAFIPT